MSEFVKRFHTATMQDLCKRCVEESMMRRLIRWLRSSWICKKCGKEFHTMNFGYGEVICPSCYNGEQPFLFPDETFLLNRLIARSR